MKGYNRGWLLLVGISLMLSLPISQAFWGNENKIKTAVFRSPKFVLGPGEVVNRSYGNIDFPRGHIALKSFNAEIIDEAGNPVSLHEAYPHHWVIRRYYLRKGVEILDYEDNDNFHGPDYFAAPNSGVCPSLDYYYAIGPETRKTSTYIPDPYGLEVGNPAKVPAGFEERWMLNMHAIDTRGVVDRIGCVECRCNLYNVTLDAYGRPLTPDYIGGLLCCYDRTQCRLKHGFEGGKRNLYLRYTVKWVDMDSSVVPVKIYIFDITDTWTRSSNQHDCPGEYDVEPCSASEGGNNQCVHSKRISLDMPFDGYIIYGVAHQHAGATGSALYRENGQRLCASIPTQGEGVEIGNEAGYVVGMSTSYPEPGTVKISKGETIIIESNYSSVKLLTGLMGLFYILVADQPPPKPMYSSYALVQTRDNVVLLNILWAAVALMGTVTIIAVAIRYSRKCERKDGYQTIKL